MRRFALITIATCLLGLASSAPAAEWATLKGQFVFGKKGTEVPKQLKLTPTKDVAVCSKHDLYDETLVINSANRGVANIMIWAYKPKKVHPDYKEEEGKEIKIDNKFCRFEPHAVAVSTKQTLVVGNSDPVGHNSLMNFFKNPAQNPIIPAKSSLPFKLTAAELLPTKISCSIHPWMQGIVLVQDHPYMAVTDKDGKFELKNLPAGKLTIRLWQEKIGYVKSATIDNKATKFKSGRYSVTLNTDEEKQFILNPKDFAGK